MNSVFKKVTTQGLWIVIAALLINFWVSYRNLEQLSDNQQRLVHSQLVSGALSGLLLTLKDLEASQRAYLITGNESALQPFDRGLKDLDARIVQLRTLTQNDALQREGLAILQERIGVRTGALQQTLKARRDNGFEAAAALVASERGKRAMDAVSEQVASMRATEDSRLQPLGETARMDFRTALISNSIATLIGLGLAWAVWWWVRREMAARGHLASIVESSGDAIASFDFNGRIQSWNASAARLFGYEADEVIGRDGRILVPDDRIGEVQDVVTALAAGKSLPSRRTERRHKDGSIVEVLLTASPLTGSDGRPAGISAIAHDLGEYRRAERALLDSRSQLRLIIDTAPVFIVDCDSQVRYRLVNKAYAQRYGMAPAAFVGKHVWDVLGQTAYAALRPYIEQALTGVPIEFEVRVPYDDLGERMLQAHCVPKPDSAGGFDGFVAVIEDVSERHAGRRIAAELAAIVESSEDAIIGKDLNGRITSWNPAASRLFGYRNSEMIGQSITRLIPPELADQEEEILGQLRKGQRVDRFEAQRVAKDGRRLDLAITISPIRDEHGHVVGASKFAHDIGARKRSEAAQQIRQQRLEIATAAAALGVYEWDIAADEAHWENARMYEIFGRAIAEGPLSRSEFLDSVVHPDDQETVRRVLFDDIRPGPLFQLACRIRRQRDGAWRWIEFVGRGLADADGGARRLTGVLADITERRQLEIALREGDRRKDEFLAMLAHELRNPLAPLKNAAELMRLAHADNPELTQIQSLIDRQVRHLSHLLDDLLDASRINQGKITLAREPLELKVLLVHALESTRPFTDARNHHVALVFPPQPLWIEADAVRLTQVICNLVNNAAKFTDPGGRIQVIAEPAGRQVVIRVIDNGQGIEADLLPHIFELFIQGQRAPDRSQGGLGIGLSLARKLTVLHGGDLSASSGGPGCGCEFVVRLPLIDPPAQPETSGIRAPAAPVRRRVLVVDDNVDAAQSLSVLLTIAGHQAQAVYDGLAALSLAETFKPECVVLDIGLPQMDGYEVARRLRQMSQTRDATLIVLSGYGRAEDRRRSEAAGIDHHLVKPVNLEVLEALIQ